MNDLDVHENDFHLAALKQIDHLFLTLHQEVFKNSSACFY